LSVFINVHVYTKNSTQIVFHYTNTRCRCVQGNWWPNHSFADKDYNTDISVKVFVVFPRPSMFHLGQNLYIRNTYVQNTKLNYLSMSSLLAKTNYCRIEALIND